jgi:surface polysaccharide O-acyltransferase-like enzyme
MANALPPFVFISFRLTGRVLGGNRIDQKEWNLSKLMFMFLLVTINNACIFNYDFHINQALSSRNQCSGDDKIVQNNGCPEKCCPSYP